MKNLLKAIIGIGAVYGLCRASFMSGVGAGMGVAAKEVLEAIGGSVSADDITSDAKLKDLDQVIVQLWYNGTIKTMCKETEG